MRSNKIKLTIYRVATVIFLLSALTVSGFAQTEEEVKDTTVKALLLYKLGQYVEAEPHLAKLVGWIPESSQLRIMYGTALLAKSKQIDDNEEAKLASALALEQFQEAKRLGDKSSEVDELIAILGGDADESGSENAAPRSAFEQAEVKFAQSKYDEALVLYKKALEEDPKNYLAALYSADCLMQLQEYEKAETFYQKAIAIDPDRETAYRYSATYLMKNKEFDTARDRYIEAYITEPYGGMAVRGITQWAEVTGAKLGHPEVDIPEIKFGDNGKPTTVMKKNSVSEASKAWLAYSVNREAWYKEKFIREFPNESKYRHTLREEAESIRKALASAKQQQIKHPHFDILQKIDDDGLLEAFVLLALANEGIADDHTAYLKQHRPELRKYVLNYVIQK